MSAYAILDIEVFDHEKFQVGGFGCSSKNVARAIPVLDAGSRHVSQFRGLHEIILGMDTVLQRMRLKLW